MKFITPKPVKHPDAPGLYEFLEFLEWLIPEGHDRCTVDSACAGGPDPCHGWQPEGRAR